MSTHDEKVRESISQICNRLMNGTETERDKEMFQHLVKCEAIPAQAVTMVNDMRKYQKMEVL